MIDKLRSVFNSDFVDFKESTVIISETQKTALVTNIEFFNAHFYSFNKEVLSKTQYFFEKTKGEASLTESCDGMLLFYAKGKWNLFLIELKSSFKPEHVSKAQEQIQCTFPRLMMPLEIIKDIVRSKELHVQGFIVSNPPTSEQKTRILKKAGGVDGYCIEKLCVKLINNLESVITKENSILSRFSLNDNFIFNELRLHYIDAVQQKKIDVMKYL